MAPGTVTAVCACVEGGGGGTVGLQPVMVPASDEKRKRAAPELVPECTTNAVEEPLKTAPVGAPPGIETVRGTFATAVLPTAPEYRSTRPCRCPPPTPGWSGRTRAPTR